MIGTYPLTPFLPSGDIPVRETSGRMQARSRRCSGFLIQSSQNLVGIEEKQLDHGLRLADEPFGPIGLDFVPNLLGQQPAKSRKEVGTMKKG